MIVWRKKNSDNIDTDSNYRPLVGVSVANEEREIKTIPNMNISANC